MNRFFVKQDNIRNNIITFSPEQTKHLVTVLRMKKGENIFVFDGTGNEYEVELVKTSPSAEGEIRFRTFKSAASFRITLAQSIPKGEKMDWIVEKGTEIGVNKFIPFTSERTIVKLNEKSAAAKRERWQKIAIAAAEQSRGSFVPNVTNIITFRELFEQTAPDSLRLILWEEEKNTSLKSILRESKTSNVTIFIGPEGGFAQDEIGQAKKTGVIPVTLGSRILRTETAGLVVSTIIGYEFGEK